MVYFKHLSVVDILFIRIIILLHFMYPCCGLIGAVQMGTVLHFIKRVKSGVQECILLLKWLHECIVIRIRTVYELEVVDLLAHAQQVQVGQVTLRQAIFILHLLYAGRFFVYSMLSV